MSISTDSRRRRKSLSGITEGKQTLIGVIDTSVEADKELDNPAFARSFRDRSKGSIGKNHDDTFGDKKLRRRHSYQGADLQLILQNSSNESGIPLRRGNSLGDKDTKLVRRGSKGDLFSSKFSLSGTPLGTPRTPRTPTLSRTNSLGSSSVENDNKDDDMDFQSSCVKNAQKAIKRMPGRSIQSIKSNPKYGILGDASSKRGISLISRHIALGGRDDANDIRKLKGYGISHVLNVAAQMPNFFQGEFVYLKIPLQDTDDANINIIMPQAYEYIKNVESMGGRVLVHCISGVSRSTTVVLMYLMQAYEMQLLPAYNYVRSCRPFIEPNKGFRLQLAEEELRLFGQSTVADKSAGPVWEFYEWNKKKEKVKIISASQEAKKRKDSYERRGERSRADGCLESIVKIFM